MLLKNTSMGLSSLSNQAFGLLPVGLYLLRESSFVVLASSLFKCMCVFAF